jgi:flagellar basal-body rod modification protein FlgD
MSRIPSLGPAANSGSQNPKGADLRNLDMSRFMDLMIAELQNQDPLNPVDNAQLLQQISQIREIGATNQLTETLQSVLNGQQIATAGSLIGKDIRALSDDRKDVSGTVDRVTIERDPNDDTKHSLRVHVGSKSVKLKNIREILEKPVGEV